MVFRLAQTSDTGEPATSAAFFRFFATRVTRTNNDKAA
jgi:hypothetical protein